VSEGQPRLSIGVPVFNGERYLAAAIESVLDGSFDDFELIIGDNASTDRTEEIARSFVAKDDRIRYLRSTINIGPNPNFNRVFRAATGTYFKWLAYDDLCGPDMLARCVEVLDGDPSIVVCSARYVEINENGDAIAEQPYTLDLSSSKAHVRLGELMCQPRGHPILYGVMRTSTLRRTKLLATYRGSDRALLAELTLHGRLWEIPEVLWSSRDHPARSPYVHTTAGFWDSRRVPTFPPHLASSAHLAKVLATAPVSRRERLRSSVTLVSCLARRSGELVPALGRELLDAAQTMVHRPAR
jgi:glycosyltransferase involved in cell wall biosynthesis